MAPAARCASNIIGYKVNSYPTFFLFGPDRTLIERSVGYGPGMLDKWLKSLD